MSFYLPKRAPRVFHVHYLREADEWWAEIAGADGGVGCAANGESLSWARQRIRERLVEHYGHREAKRAEFIEFITL